MDSKLEEAICNGHKKFDAGKLEWHLMPEAALEQVMLVLQDGKAKYGEFNWLDNADEVQWSRYMNALERHLRAFKRGVDVDPESTRPHLAHVIANALFLLTYQLESKGVDNRRKTLKT